VLPGRSGLGRDKGMFESIANEFAPAPVWRFVTYRTEPADRLKIQQPLADNR
jgi:hypothetical protein